MKVGIIWAQFGPYHFARAAALQQLLGSHAVQAIEIASCSEDYAWKRAGTGFQLHSLCNVATVERLSFWTVFFQARRTLAALGVEVCLLPSYYPKQSLAVLLAAKSLGLKTVMMNESHAGTSRAAGLAGWVKRRLVGMFDAALVGGEPQKRYFMSLGMPAERTFVGYDAIDNEYFAARAEKTRENRPEIAKKHGLPEHYFLSLGRFVQKKNLETLIRAYHHYLETSRLKQTHLVLVGSGDEETKLRAQAESLGLPIYNHGDTVLIEKNSRDVGMKAPGIHFFGFRQVDETPEFYALADAFVLPSRHEEWGLVVNEAMACGLPVVVSHTAGCVEDLLERGRPGDLSNAQVDALMNNLKLLGLARRNGFVFDPDSAGELSRILLALETNASLREAMGRVGREIVGKFSCAKFAENALLAAGAASGDLALSDVADIRNGTGVATVPPVN